jgi:ribosomal protein S18 acetylase RimI-like enzyme
VAHSSLGILLRTPSQSHPPIGVQTRAAGIGDLPAILRAERLYLREMEPSSEAAWTLAIDRNLQLWIDNLDRTVMFEHDGSVVGYEMWMREGPVATLVTMNVSVDHRRQGLGARLLQQFQTDAARAGATELRLGVHRDNPARLLYEAAGYRFTGEEGDYLLYARSLAAAAR